jgi:HJR/Mrr/RecB family endonuclease
MNTSMIEGVIHIFFFLFAFWPLILVAPLNWRRNSLSGMMAVWCFFAVIRLIGLFAGQEMPVLIIPEPLNTIIFLSTGALLFLIIIARKSFQRRIIQMKADEARSVEDLQNLSPKEFEDMVVELYRARGHKAVRTGSVGDHGVDVVVQASNGEKWVVQCKRWRGAVGEPVIRDFHGVMQHEKADQGAIITTGTFTPQAKVWAKGKPMTLVEGSEFLALIKKARGAQTTASTPQSTGTNAIASPPICPVCGSRMVLRTAKQGANAGKQFWGCPNYPQCKGLLNIE